MKFFRLEFLLYLIAAGGLLFAGGKLFFPDMKEVPRTSTLQPARAVGFFRPLGKDVRVRGNNDVEWTKALHDTDLSENDWVSTGTKSSAWVHLTKNQKFTVEPTSLMKLTDQDGSPVVDLQEGGFFGELKKGAMWIVQSRTQKVELKSVEDSFIRVSLKENKLIFTLLKGLATAQSPLQQNPIELRAHEEITVTEVPGAPALEKFQLRPVFPPPGSIVWVDETDLSFKWEGSEEDVELEVSKDPNFKEEVKNVAVRGNQASLSLESGSLYFWRVINKTNQKRSATASFGYYPRSAPLISQETARIEADLDLSLSMNRPLSFSWSDPSFSESYLFEMSLDRHFSTIERSQRTTQSKVSIEHLQKGAYFWRVTSEHSSRPNLTSEPGAIEVLSKSQEDSARAMALAGLEKLGAPPKALEAPSVDRAELKLELWDPRLKPRPPTPGFTRGNEASVQVQLAANADSTVMEISNAENFEDALEATLTEGENPGTKVWTWRPEEAGQFFARAKSIRGEEKAYSPPIKLRVLVAAPDLDPPQILETTAEHALVHIETLGHSSTVRFELQISEDSGFKIKTASIFKPGVSQFKVHGSGKRYARARSLNSQGWPISLYSKAIVFEIPELQPAPEQGEGTNPVLAESTEPFSFKNPRASLWLGTGATFLKFDQEGANDLETGSFARISSPSYSWGVGGEILSDLSLSYEDHHWPGRISLAEGTSIDKTRYEWRSQLGELSYKFSENNRIQYSLLAGVQLHEVPFLARNQDDTVQLLNNQFQNAGLGLKLRYQAFEATELEFFMRVQGLISSKSTDGSDFRAKSNLMFDGSLGATHRFKNRLKMGIHWFGQYLDTKYDMTRNGTTSSGSQKFFNSNVQLRIGYDFFGMMLVPFAATRRRRRPKKGSDPQS